jgi:UDPglucose 6-dehydrogenase/GDP-mannose 6-dehydrogenase
MKISIIGSGYVGLVSAVGFSSVGHQVICVDKRSEVVDSINSGIAPIHENGLQEMLTDNVPKNITATTDLVWAVHNTDITFIAVGTPSNDGQIDLTSVEGAAYEVGSALEEKDAFHVVVVKSTVVPGTTDGLVKRAIEKGSGKVAGVEFGLAMNPEFLREGIALQDFMNPDRIVLGGDKVALGILADMYSPFENVPIIKTSAVTAELTKYCSNSFFALLISYSNEFANLSAKCGADVIDVIEGLSLDRRFKEDANGEVGLLSYLHPGCGYGGSCFPKDVQAISAFGDSIDSPMHIASATHLVNINQVDHILQLVENYYSPDIQGDVVLLGLSFKPDTDDVRESVGILIANALAQKATRVVVCDDLAKKNAQPLLHSEVQWVDSVVEATAKAQLIILITLSNQFRELPNLVAKLAIQPIVFDARRSFSSSQFQRYAGVGYPVGKLNT